MYAVTSASEASGCSGSSSRSTAAETSVIGASRNSRWMCTAPRYRPVGVSIGGRATNTNDAFAGVRSGFRTWASASATVAVGGSTIGSEVMMPPAVSSR